MKRDKLIEEQALSVCSEYVTFFKEFVSVGTLNSAFALHLSPRYGADGCLACGLAVDHIMDYDLNLFEKMKARVSSGITPGWRKFNGSLNKAIGITVLAMLTLAALIWVLLK